MRLIRHLVNDFWSINRTFPRAALERIEAAITAQERRHDGELRFAVEAALGMADLWHGVDARQRAIDLFARLHVWDTERNSGVLVYVLLADRRVEIVADRGIDARVGPGEWDRICRRMEVRFRAGEFEQGVLDGLGAISDLLAAHFPPVDDNPDELPNRPVVL